MYEKEFWRCTILELHQSQVAVVLVDLGPIVAVPKHALKRLNHHFLATPPLAVRAALLGLGGPRDQWPKAVTDLFRSVVFKKTVFIFTHTLLLLRVSEAFCSRRRSHSGPIEL